MKPFTNIRSTAVPLPLENVDTDQIIPARFLKAVKRSGFGEKLFYDWRYQADGSTRPEFVLNNKNYSGSILVAGKNFGCGSSREHAAWAIYDYGFRAVISSFFADIFSNNAMNNGLLPVVIPEGMLQKLLHLLQENPSTIIEISLENQLFVIPDTGDSARFEISPYRKQCLLKGLDDIDYLVSIRDRIIEFEQREMHDYEN